MNRSHWIWYPGDFEISEWNDAELRPRRERLYLAGLLPSG